MTEDYWKRYKEKLLQDPMNTNELWKHVKQDLKERETPKHHLELYSYCRNDNPYIRQIKASPNITINTVAELICRDQACELQYCLALQKVAAGNRRSGLDLQECRLQYNTMNSCLMKEKTRIKRKELELRNKVLGIKVEEAPLEEQSITSNENVVQVIENKAYM